MGGYIAPQVAIENKELIEKLVLIDSSSLLEGPTPLLNEYRITATETEPILRYKKLEIVFGDMYANRSFMPPVVVDAFIGTIIKQGAKNAFEKAFDNSTSTRLESEDLKLIEDIQCLIIWGYEGQRYTTRICVSLNRSSQMLNV